MFAGPSSSRLLLVELAAVALLSLGSSPASDARNVAPFRLNQNHPIVVDGQLFGGTSHTKWLARAGFAKTRKGKDVNPQPGQPVLVESPLFQGTETFRLYDKSGFLGYGHPANKLRYVLEETGLERYDVALNALDKRGSTWRVAINGDWNALPRPFKELKPQRLFAVDVDGDGKDERIKVQTKPLARRSAKTGPVGELVTLTFEMKGKTAPFTSIELDAELTTSWELMALDCDGDGKLELLLTTEGKDAFVELYEIKNTKPVMVLATPPEK